MTIDERARAAAAAYRSRAELSVDAPPMLVQLQHQRSRQSKVAWAVAAAATAVVVAAAGWVAIRPADQTNSQPIQRPTRTATPTPTPTPTKTERTVEHGQVNICHPTRYLDVCPVPAKGSWMVIAPEFEPLDPYSYERLEPWKGTTAQLGVDLSGTEWELRKFEGTYIQIVLPNADDDPLVNVFIVAGPYMNPLAADPYVRRTTPEILQWIELHPNLSRSEPETVRLSGLSAWRTTVSASASMPIFAVPQSYSHTSTHFGIKDGNTVTLILTDEATGWPLVIEIEGNPATVEAHDQDIQQLLDSISITQE